MDSTDLETLCAVVEHGGVTAAARQLHRVQSSVSARLAALERHLGCALFDRVGKAMHLTPEGRHLYERSAPLLQALQALQRDMLASGTAAACLRLGAMESTAAARLPQPLVALQRAQPGLRIVLRTGPSARLLQALVQGEIDAALVAGQPQPGALAWHAVWHETLVRIAPLGAAAAPAPLIAFAEGCAYRAVALDWAATQAAGVGDAVVEIGSYHALMACVAAGMGVALVPRAVLQLAGEAAQAVRVQPLPRRWARQTTWLVHRKASPSGAVAALRAQLLQGRAPG